jgi:4-amino-4-deoxy-L-arabinose transferase-like glycosyltransferase
VSAPIDSAVQRTPASRRALWRPPAPLAALLGAVFALGLAWALVVPPFQAPDEQSHFGYVQSLVSGPGLPGAAGHQAFSSEQLSAQDISNSDQTAAQIHVKPTWSAEEWERWQRLDAGAPQLSRGDGGGSGNPAGANPPLYYAYEAIPYAVFSGGDFFSRVTAMRIASVLWLLATVAGAWLLAGELFGHDRLLQLVSAGVAGLLPMATFVSAQIGPDTMMYALWTLALWLGVRILRRGATTGPTIALLGLVGLATVVKATSYALVPAAVLGLGVTLWRIRAERRRATRLAVGALAALVAPVVAWFAIARLGGHAVAAQLTDASSGDGSTNVRELASYLWQYYLPRLPFMDSIDPTGGGVPAFQVFVKQSWGAFGWLEVRFPDGLYTWFGALTALVGLAALARLATRLRRVDVAVTAYLALAVASLLAGLHWTDYHQWLAGGAFMQGRYLFPLLALAGAATALAIAWLPGRLRAAAAGVVLGGLFALQLASLALVAARFYA